jgi:hypothetical protein
MDDPIPTNRRRFLESVSIGGGVLLAGCSDQLGLGGDDGTETQPATDGAGDSDVAAIATIDQEALQEEQVSIQEDVQNGNMTQQEAQQALVELQEKYVTEAVESLAGTLEETEGVSPGDTYESLGAVTITGDAETILSLLSSDDVQALVSRATIEEQLSAQQG